MPYNKKLERSDDDRPKRRATAVPAAIRLLQGYRDCEDAPPVPRRRIGEAAQMRQRFGVLMPIEVRTAKVLAPVAATVHADAAEPSPQSIVAGSRQRAPSRCRR